jgi:hypothetical protein
MHEIILSSVMDGIDALKSASKGLPNTLLRDINAIHPNAAFADLPKELQAAIAASVRGAFNRLLKEGYSVSQGQQAPARSPAGDRPPRGDRPGGDRPRGDRPRGDRPGGRPPGGARPGAGPGGRRPAGDDKRPPRPGGGGGRPDRGPKPGGPGKR